MSEKYLTPLKFWKSLQNGRADAHSEMEPQVQPGREVCQSCSSRSRTFGFILTRPKCGKGAMSMWVTWMLVQLRLLPDGEHNVNMPSLFQFSVCEFDVFNLELTAKSLSLSLLYQGCWEAWSCLF